MKRSLSVLLIVMMCSCGSEADTNTNETTVTVDTIRPPVIAPPAITKTQQIIKLFTKYPEFAADGFDYPVGKPNAKEDYNAQGFAGTTHLGDNWKAVTGGNSDLGDPVYGVANGHVNFVEDIGGGWGDVFGFGIGQPTA